MRRFAIGVLAVTAISLGALAQTTSTGSMSLQGRLTGIADGTRQLMFYLHDSQIGGNQVASVGPIAAAVSGGAFSANIGVQPAVFDGRTLWWSVAVDGGAATERHLVTSVPYAGAASTLPNNAATQGRLNIGPVNPAGTGVLPGFGESLWLDGGPAPAARSSRNSDNLWLARYNVSDDTTQLRVNVGDGLASNDSFRVGTCPSSVLEDYTAVFVVNMQGDGWFRRDLDVDGRVVTGVLQIVGGSDLAEAFPASPSKAQAVEPKPGMVLSIDPDNPGALRVATDAYDTRVAGVYSGGNGLPTGMMMGKEGCSLTAPGEDRLPLAMTGRVWVYADESNGIIRPGDRLTTSGIKPGHAMKATDTARWDGAVIGKAMTGVDLGTGMVLVLVNLQ